MGNPNALPNTAALTPLDVQAAIARLHDLPASAPIVRRALAELENPEFAVADVKKTLLSDSALAARVLRLANSAYFGFRSEVQTVSQAIVLLGPQRIRTLLRRILVDKIMADLASRRPDAAPVRRMSLATATASCTLSQLLLREDAEEMLLGGLLHNIGELFFLSQFPAEYLQVRRLAENLHEKEAAQAVFGITSCQAGKQLLGRWNFPLLYRVVVEHIDEPLAANYPAELTVAVSLVHSGKKLAEAFVADLEAAEAVTRVSPEVSSLLGLDSELLAEVYQTLPQRMSLEQLQAGRR